MIARSISSPWMINAVPIFCFCTSGLTETGPNPYQSSYLFPILTGEKATCPAILFLITNTNEIVRAPAAHRPSIIYCFSPVIERMVPKGFPGNYRYLLCIFIFFVAYHYEYPLRIPSGLYYACFDDHVKLTFYTSFVERLWLRVYNGCQPKGLVWGKPARIQYLWKIIPEDFARGRFSKQCGEKGC